MEHFPALNADCFDQHIAERLQLHEPPRILILYGSVRERSYSRFTAEPYRIRMRGGSWSCRRSAIC